MDNIEYKQSMKLALVTFEIKLEREGYYTGPYEVHLSWDGDATAKLSPEEAMRLATALIAAANLAP